ncbi:hypothetical protein PLICRDRAFT_680330 [Plicaturopsis crispa FD-325 SS-3]|nr:hypothetical protein PLICRDRAFT_680330 [Plicaturopsis crispa FD-325 SS-3]
MSNTPPAPVPSSSTAEVDAGNNTDLKSIARSIKPRILPNDPNYEGEEPGWADSFRELWNGRTLPDKIVSALDSLKVQFNTINVHRRSYEEEDMYWYPGPLTLYIGVRRGTLSCEDGAVAAAKCDEVLAEYGVTDVDVMISECVLWGSHAEPQERPKEDHKAFKSKRLERRRAKRR